MSARRALGAPKRSTRLEPPDIYLWWIKSRRQPRHKETWERLATRASELRVRSKSWRARYRSRRPTLALPALSRAIESRRLKVLLSATI
eukprot:6190526-Pleurochrysis_carterae.AAC.1